MLSTAVLQTISSLEKDIAGLKKEIGERDETIGDKEKRIYDLKKKNQASYWCTRLCVWGCKHVSHSGVCLCLALMCACQLRLQWC